MNSYSRLTLADTKKVLPKFEGEDECYHLLPKRWFEKSHTQSILGCKTWYYSLGGSDCGKFTLRLLADIAERFSKTFCQWGSSGGGGADSGLQNSRLMEHSDAPILGFCKYIRRDGKAHICGATITEEAPDKPYFFERTETDIRQVYMNPQEFESIIYIRAF